MTLRSRLIAMLLVTASAAASFPATVFADAEDDPLLIMVQLDEFEIQDPGGSELQAWKSQGWFGRDLEKLWLKFEGERKTGDTEKSELQLLYSKGVSTYWDFQAGLRHDFEPSPSRTWLAVGFQGLAPYLFEIDAALFVGESGQTALRFEAEYEFLLTQRWILSPDIEINVYGKDDPALGIGAGLSGIEAGIRLRYEIRREFAPYIGVSYARSFGSTADILRAAGAGDTERELVIGIRAWF